MYFLYENCFILKCNIFFYHNILQVSLNQEDLNLLFRILAENLGEGTEDLDKVKPRVQETGKRLTVSGIIRMCLFIYGLVGNQEISKYMFTNCNLYYQENKQDAIE